MSEKLCPYCGHEYYVNADGIHRCGNYKGRCPLAVSNTDFTSEQWNKRFVCLDSKGKKVFNGNKVDVGGINGRIVADMVRGLGLRTNGVTVPISHKEITLIESEDKS